jgi:hypothetical protein
VEFTTLGPIENFYLDPEIRLNTLQDRYTRFEQLIQTGDYGDDLMAHYQQFFEEELKVILSYFGESEEGYNTVFVFCRLQDDQVVSGQLVGISATPYLLADYQYEMLPELTILDTEDINHDVPLTEIISTSIVGTHTKKPLLN